MYAQILKGAKKASDAGNNMDKDVQGAVLETQCWRCRHLHRDTPTNCDAFPKGIPLLILLGEYDHTFEYDVDGLSDEGVTFSPI